MRTRSAPGHLAPKEIDRDPNLVGQKCPVRVEQKRRGFEGRGRHLVVRKQVDQSPACNVIVDQPIGQESRAKACKRAFTQGERVRDQDVAFDLDLGHKTLAVAE